MLHLPYASKRYGLSPFVGIPHLLLTRLGGEQVLCACYEQDTYSPLLPLHPPHHSPMSACAVTDGMMA